MNDNVKIGVTGWNDQTFKPRVNKFEDAPRFEYLKLKKGGNMLRIITAPYKYAYAKFKGPNDKGFGRAVSTAWPAYAGSCPAVDIAGLWSCDNDGEWRAKYRYYVGVIDREDENTVKIFDMKLSVYEGLQTKISEQIEMMERMGQSVNSDLNPLDLDIMITFNPESSTPGGYYSVALCPVAPVSEEDQNKISEHSENLNSTLERFSACPKPERVDKRLRELGWDGNPVVVEVKASESDSDKSSDSEGSSEGDTSAEAQSSESQSDDLDFSKRPSAQA